MFTISVRHLTYFQGYGATRADLSVTIHFSRVGSNVYSWLGLVVVSWLAVVDQKIIKRL